MKEPKLEYEINITEEYVESLKQRPGMKEWYEERRSEGVEPAGPEWDEWGMAQIWSQEEGKGAEYNYCNLDDGTSASAIYKMTKVTEEDGSEYWDTDGCTFIHHEIDFGKNTWREELKEALHRAFLEFFPEYK